MQRRRWVAPDGVRYQLAVVEQVDNYGSQLRRIRRLHFEGENGVLIGTAVVPGYFMLDLASSLDLYDLWRRAIAG